jgi:hypothetical protein
VLLPRLCPVLHGCCFQLLGCCYSDLVAGTKGRVLYFVRSKPSTRIPHIESRAGRPLFVSVPNLLTLFSARVCADGGKETKDAEEVEDDNAPAPEGYKPKFLTLEHTSWLLPRAPRTLMWRECFDPLIEAIVVYLHGGDVLLTGSSGTGKTQLQAVLLATLQKLGVPVVLDLEDGALALIDPDAAEDKRVQFGERGVSFFKQLNSRQTVYLFDARPAPNGPTNVTLCPLDVEAATCVSASPVLSRNL